MRGPASDGNQILPFEAQPEKERKIPSQNLVSETENGTVADLRRQVGTIKQEQRTIVEHNLLILKEKDYRYI